MNKFILVVLAIVLAACGSSQEDDVIKSGDTIATPRTIKKPPAVALRDSAMQIVYGAKGEVEYEKSLKLLEEAMALDPENKSIFFSKMQVLSKYGSEEEIFNMLIRLDTMPFKDPNSTVQLGVEYELRGEMDKADAKYHDAINVYAAILDTMQNTPTTSRNNNILNLAVAERLVKESSQKLQSAMNDEEKQYLADNIKQIEDATREDLFKMSRKKKQ